MRRILLLAAALCGVWGQEVPVTGIFRDDSGALRALQGIEGSWVAPILVPEGVVSAASNGRWTWYKTASELHVREPKGRWVAVSGPDGRAVGQYSADGNVAGFVFPDAGVAAAWDASAMELGPLLPWREESGDLEALEPLGENLYLLRRDGVLLAWRPGAEPWVIPLAETASFQLFLRDGQGEIPVANALTLPPAAPGETSEVRFRLRNPAGAPVAISRLSVDPGAFKIFDQFFPPRTIEPGGFADFAVRFSPPSAGVHSTNLFVNDTKVVLSASAEAVPVLEVELPAGWQTLRAGETVDLGAVERRSVLRRRLRATPAVQAQVQGAGFQLESAEAAGEFAIVFSSDAAGIATGLLQAGGRSFPLRVTVTDFPTPRPSIVFPAEPKTAQQSRLIVRLAEPARTAYTVVLALSFQPDAGLPDDSAVALLPQAVRSVPVRFAEGESQSQEIVFQTGTTAGQLTLTATLGPYAESRTVRIRPEPVVLSVARAAASAAAAEVVFTGFDTTRTVSRLSFTFFLKNGQAASPGRIDAEVGTAFSNYFKTVSGGAFTLRANFPVAGTSTELEGVEVEIVNSAGTSQAGRLRFE